LSILSGSTISHLSIDSDGLSNKVENVPRSAWVRDIPCLWITNPTANQGKSVMIRLIIHPFDSENLPRSQKIIMTSPQFDLFFHWTFNCNPFSFSTLVKNMKWNIGDDEKDFLKLFEGFGGTIRERILECATQPERYSL
jgi:hypothetical protein